MHNTARLRLLRSGYSGLGVTGHLDKEIHTTVASRSDFITDTALYTARARSSKGGGMGTVLPVPMSPS
jgi:hypothetical protein